MKISIVIPPEFYIWTSITLGILVILLFIIIFKKRKTIKYLMNEYTYWEAKSYSLYIKLEPEQRKEFKAEWDNSDFVKEMKILRKSK